MIGRVFLVRHGRTAFNADGRLRGHLNPPLDQVGRQEVAALAAELPSQAVVKIVSSPLLRALQTAQAIAEATGVPVTVVGELIDRDYGTWAGELEDEVVGSFGSVDAAPGAESMAALTTRSRAALEWQLPALGRGDVVLVSHDAVNKTLLADLDRRLAGDRLQQRTACWNEIRRQRGRWVVTRVDQKTETPTRPTMQGPVR